ncbi:putative benzoate 4-monooxygenase cytochrome p450 [Diaporthe ampelina]|uniref:Putative benzoate 4-monooxygenase cytochrome p450 n=1 Tax=Diaporthe ampelina TaxID=1214573 RepID=A0A0G2FRV4_9PEZI|nr:putative benzoate 4-monooxygenase cytochrome p450 [Diaporthe ampelina]
MKSVRLRNPMGETDPATKIKLSRHLAAGYLLTNLLQAEPAVDDTVELLLGWLDRHADKHRPIDLDRFFTYTTFDVVGEAILSKSLGFLREGRDIGGNIANSLAQKTYVAVGGFAQWFHLLLSNPLVTWEVQSAASNAVAAGADTVACGLQAFVYHIIRRPGLWRRVRADIDEAGLSAPGARKKVVPYAEAQKLPLLQACIKGSTEGLQSGSHGTPACGRQGRGYYR